MPRRGSDIPISVHSLAPWTSTRVPQICFAKFRSGRESLQNCAFGRSPSRAQRRWICGTTDGVRAGVYLAASQRQEAAGRVRLARSSAKCVTAAVGAWSRDGPLTQGGRAETRMTADAFRQHDSVGVMALQLLLRFLTDFGISFEVITF